MLRSISCISCLQPLSRGWTGLPHPANFARRKRGGNWDIQKFLTPLCSAAFLIFLAAPTRTGVVSANFLTLLIFKFVLRINRSSGGRAVSIHSFGRSTVLLSSFRYSGGGKITRGSLFFRGSQFIYGINHLSLDHTI